MAAILPSTRRVLLALVLPLLVAAPAHAVVPAGSFDSSWGMGGAAPLPADEAWLRPQVVPSFGGRTLIVAKPADGASRVQVARLDLDGGLDATWASDGVAEVDVATPVSRTRALADGSGGAWVYGTRASGSTTTSWIVHLSAQGVPDAGAPRDVPLDDVRDAAVTPARLLLVGRAGAVPTVVALDCATGGPDPTWSGDGAATVSESPGVAVRIVHDSVGRATVTWVPADLAQYYAEPYGWVQLGVDGSVVPGIGRAPTSSASGWNSVALVTTFLGSSDMVLAAQHHVTYGGRYGDRPSGLAGDIVRLEPGGTTTTTMSTSPSGIRAIATATNARRYVLADPSIHALTADGQLDRAWSGDGVAAPDPNTGVPKPTDVETAVIVASDGKVRRLIVSGEADTTAPRLTLEGGPCRVRGIYCAPVVGRPMVLSATASDAGPAWVRFTYRSGQGLRVLRDRGRHVFRAGRPCIHLSAVDAVGNASPWILRCRRPMHSEQFLVASSGWRSVSSTAFLGGRARVTRTAGATLHVPERLHSSPFTLLVTKCPACGSFTAPEESGARGVTISLRASRVLHRQRVTLYGAASIVTVSRAPVIIDGFEPSLPSSLTTCASPYESEWDESPYPEPLCR